MGLVLTRDDLLPDCICKDYYYPCNIVRGKISPMFHHIKQGWRYHWDNQIIGKKQVCYRMFLLL